jgi:hypothetical protein
MEGLLQDFAFDALLADGSPFWDGAVHSTCSTTGTIESDFIGRLD